MSSLKIGHSKLGSPIGTIIATNLNKTCQDQLQPRARICTKIFSRMRYSKNESKATLTSSCLLCRPEEDCIGVFLTTLTSSTETNWFNVQLESSTEMWSPLGSFAVKGSGLWLPKPPEQYLSLTIMDGGDAGMSRSCISVWQLDLFCALLSELEERTGTWDPFVWVEDFDRFNFPWFVRRIWRISSNFPFIAMQSGTEHFSVCRISDAETMPSVLFSFPKSRFSSIFANKSCE